MDAPTAPVSNVADRLMQLGTRLRERAVAQGTFDSETAETVEELARLAAAIAQLVNDVRNLHGYMDTMRRAGSF